jgi:hypothetical protein
MTETMLTHTFQPHGRGDILTRSGGYRPSVRPGVTHDQRLDARARALAGDFATGMRTSSTPTVIGDFATGMRTSSTPAVSGDFATGMRTFPALVAVGDFATGMRAARAPFRAGRAPATEEESLALAA